MWTILLVKSSPRGSASYSNQVAERVVSDLRKNSADAKLIVRDLAQAPLPHIDDDFVAATRSQPVLRARNSAPFWQLRTLWSTKCSAPISSSSPRP